ncbi:MAG: hypothetical protein HY731_06250 [Candidatus Tectomicrobia bacterium]|nr:hypothetical protein [Candidatus Tectomicrobia bacterium]
MIKTQNTDPAIPLVTSQEVYPETFEQFKNSFSYGSRNDLLFKFLKQLQTDDASEFFRGLLEKLGKSFDDGNFDRIVQHAYEWQVRGYTPAPDQKGQWVYTEGPLTPLKKPVSESRLALLTSTGHFVDGNDPEPFGVKNMTQEEAVRRIGDFLKSAPQLVSIPIDTSLDKLRVRHGGYDIRGVQADSNVAFPLSRLRELEAEGVIGKLAPNAYSFLGAVAQLRLLKESAPQWAALLKEQQVDAVLMVPV